MEDFTKRPEFAGMPVGHQTTCMNYLNFPRIARKFTDENVAIFNAQVNYFKSINLPKIERTPSGYIKRCSFGYAWDTQKIGNSAIELTVTTWYATYRLVLTNNVDEYGDATKMTGRKAYVTMRREFQKDGIDLEDYAVPNGKEIKKHEIEKPMIMATNHLQFGKTYENVYHLDFHSSYPGGLANHYPEMRKTIERIYAKRKSSDKDGELKLALDASIGFFQSQYCKINKHGYALANLARDAVNDNNERIRRVTSELVASGRIPLLYNTDGIWYIGEPLENGADYGPGVGRWENDHTALKFRAKSRGAYEYIDADGYHPVVRGKTKLEETKSRDTWEWGDIFQIGGIKKFGLSQNGTVVGEYVDEDEE